MNPGSVLLAPMSMIFCAFWLWLLILSPRRQNGAGGEWNSKEQGASQMVGTFTYLTLSFDCGDDKRYAWILSVPSAGGGCHLRLLAELEACLLYSRATERDTRNPLKLTNHGVCCPYVLGRNWL